MVGEILRPDLSVANLVSQDLVSLSPTDTRKHTCKLSSSRFHVEKEENEREREREERERGFKVASHTQHRHTHTHTHTLALPSGVYIHAYRSNSRIYYIDAQGLPHNAN